MNFPKHFKHPIERGHIGKIPVRRVRSGVTMFVVTPGRPPIRRQATGIDSTWEDFEYLTVLSRRWLADVRSCYPKGVEHILAPSAPVADRKELTSRVN
jgi:hypothetical protein